MSYCFETIILVEICIKMRYFYRKIEKIAQRLGASPPVPLASGGWGLCPKSPSSDGWDSPPDLQWPSAAGICPQTPNKPFHREILATPLFRLDQVFIRIYLSFAKMSFFMYCRTERSALFSVVVGLAFRYHRRRRRGDNRPLPPLGRSYIRANLKIFGQT